MTNEEFLKMVLQKAEYTEEQINTVLQMKAKDEEPAAAEQKDAAQPEPEKKPEPDSKDTTADDTAALRKELDEVKKQLADAQKRNSTQDNSNQSKPSAQEQLNEIARRFM